MMIHYWSHTCSWLVEKFSCPCNSVQGTNIALLLQVKSRKDE